MYSIFTEFWRSWHRLVGCAAWFPASPLSMRNIMLQIWSKINPVPSSSDVRRTGESLHSDALHMESPDHLDIANQRLVNYWLIDLPVGMCICCYFLQIPYFSAHKSWAYLSLWGFFCEAYLQDGLSMGKKGKWEDWHNKTEWKSSLEKVKEMYHTVHLFTH